MANPPERYGRPMRVTERVYNYLDPGSFRIYELVVTTVWVEERPRYVFPHRFKAWFHYIPNGVRLGPLRTFAIPVLVINAVLDEDPADPLDGMVESPTSRPAPVETEESANEST